jgi:hypothetical protein
MTSFSPACGIGFAETSRSRELVEVRIRAGSRAGASRPHPSFGTNPARKVIVHRMKFESAAPFPSQGCGGQDRDGFPSLRLGLLFLRQLPRMMRPKPQRALLGSPMSQLTRDISRVLNFCRHLTGWSFRSLHHLRQEPRSVFAVPFRPSLSAVSIHARNKAWRWTHEVHENSASGA